MPQLRSDASCRLCSTRVNRITTFLNLSYPGLAINKPYTIKSEVLEGTTVNADDSHERAVVYDRKESIWVEKTIGNRTMLHVDHARPQDRATLKHAILDFVSVSYGRQLKRLALNVRSR